MIGGVVSGVISPPVRGFARNTGEGVIFDFTIVSLGRVIRPTTRVIDTRS